MKNGFMGMVQRGFDYAKEKLTSTVGKVAAAVGALVGAGQVTVAKAAVVMPAADYTDIELAAAIGFGIAITVGLLMKAKRFFA